MELICGNSVQAQRLSGCPNMYVSRRSVRLLQRTSYLKTYIIRYTDAARIFPPTKDYARIMLMIHKPWWGDNDFSKSCDYTKEFYEFISKDASDSLKMGFYHAKKVHEDRYHSETVIKVTTIKDDEMDKEYYDIFYWQKNILA